jgi:hypothetical protein
MYPAVKYFKLAEFYRTYDQQRATDALLEPSPSRAQTREPARLRPESSLSDDMVAAAPYEQRAARG